MNNREFYLQKNKVFAAIMLSIFLFVSCFGTEVASAAQTTTTGQTGTTAQGNNTTTYQNQTTAQPGQLGQGGSFVGTYRDGTAVYAQSYGDTYAAQQQVLQNGGTLSTTNTGQAGGYTNGQNTGTSTANAYGSIGSCVGGLASSFVTGFINGLLGKLDSSHVPTQGNNDGARAGFSIGVFGASVKLPSWDSISDCVLNGLISYVTQSLITWIQSGFNGNPAFISNPKQFFSDIANIEAGTFINQIAHDTTGLNLCQPLRLQIGTGLLNQYGQRASPLTCSLDQMHTTLSNPANYQAYVANTGVYNSYSNAQFYNNWQAVAMTPQNNSYGATFFANQQMQARIQTQQNTASLNLNWAHGYFPIQNCPPATYTTDGSGKQVEVRKPCTTTTPGSIIEGKINNTLNLGNHRLAISDKFDQVVSVLIGTLVNMGLSKVLSSTQ